MRATTSLAPVSVPCMDPKPTPRGSRVAALDGLRGLTILMVILGHYVFIWPELGLASTPVVQGLFMGGAVDIFFIVGGFVVTRGLLRERENGVLDPLRFYLRRMVRLGVQLVPLAIVILLIHTYDSTDTSTTGDTIASVTNVLTYTWNHYAIDNIATARPDLGHLWYLSVQQQAYLVLPLVILVFARFRRLLVALLAVATVLTVINRYRVVDEDGWFTASLLTTTRVDGLLLGVLVAVCLPVLSRWKTWSSRLLAASAAALVILIGVHDEFGPLAFLSGWGILFTLASTCAVAALVSGGATGPVGRALGHGWLTTLGNASLPLFVWHVPVFLTLARHTGSWHPAVRSAAAVAVLVVVVVLAQRFIEEPTRAWLRRSPRFRTPTPPELNSSPLP